MTLESPGPVHVTDGAWGFEYGDLESLGVYLAPEQLDLFAMSQVRTLHALSYGWSADPMEKYFLKPWMSMDSASGDISMVALPTVVQIGPQWWRRQAEAKNLDSGWFRYPSVPGGKMDYSQWEGQFTVGMLDSQRLWNLWPVQDEAVDDVLDAFAEWQDSEDMLELSRWVATNRGELDECEYLGGDGLYDGYGNDEDADAENAEQAADYGHEHRKVESDYDGRYYWECVTGQEAFHGFYADHFREVGGRIFYLDAPQVIVPDYLQQVWDDLLISSRLHTEAAVDAVPHWERDALIRREKDYSPWLWLCSLQEALF